MKSTMSWLTAKKEIGPILFVFVTGIILLKSGFNLPDTLCFDEEFDLKICRKQTNEMKQLYRDFPNQYRCLPNHTPFDFLPSSNQKSDPSQFYELHFRMVRLEIKPGFFETLVTNTDYSPEKLKDLYAYRWGIETSFRDLKYSIGLTHFHAKKEGRDSPRNLRSLYQF